MATEKFDFTHLFCIFSGGFSLAALIFAVFSLMFAAGADSVECPQTQEQKDRDWDNLKFGKGKGESMSSMEIRTRMQDRLDLHHERMRKIKPPTCDLMCLRAQENQGWFDGIAGRDRDVTERIYNLGYLAGQHARRQLELELEEEGDDNDSE